MGAAASVIGSVGGSQGSSIISGLVSGLLSTAYYKEVGGPTLRRLGAQEAAEIRSIGHYVRGRQTAGYAKAGVRTDVGSPLHVAAATEARTELAALKALYRYRQAAWEQREQAKIQIVSSLLMAGGSVGQAILQRRPGTAPKLGSSSSLFAPNNAAVNTIPSPYSVDYGGYA